MKESLGPPGSVGTESPDNAQKFILEVLKGDRLL